ncbi:MAG TPA: flavin monoamine oxidase family protein [Thermoleophilaceae bacterium]
MDRTYTRRKLLGTGAAAGAALWLPTAATAKRHKRKHRRVDVAIVGAGLAGLTAARELTRAGYEVCVLEARDRVGGRTLNHHVSKGVIAEAGGEYIGPTQNHIAALAKQMGVKTFKTYNTGDDIQYLRGQVSRYPATGLPTDADVQQGIIAAVTQLDPMAQQVPVGEPWKAKRAAEWDAMTFDDWIKANLPTEVARQVLLSASEAIWGADPAQMSLLYVLGYIAASGDEKTKGSIIPLISTGGGAQDSRFVGGSQLVAQKLAAKLGSHVVLRSPVRSVHQDGHGVTVTSDRVVVDAKQVIMAIPPVLLNDVHFSPEVPRMRRNLAKRIIPGHLIKWEAIYDHPFWRDVGLSGQAVADVGPVRTTFDNSPPSGKPGILFGFIGGSEAAAVAKMTAKARREVVLSAFETYYGPQARTLLGSFEMDWTKEPWTKGCPVGYTRPGTLRRYGPALRVPFRRVHWAGTEVATYWSGYMDGAVRSGEVAAKEVRKALKHKS